MHEIVTAIEVMKEWCIVNRMIVNPSKSGILRILNRKRKTPGIVNPLNIPEVDKYNYLGITITQSLKLHDHVIKLRITEKYLGTRINILQATLKTQKWRNYYTRLLWNQNEFIKLKPLLFMTINIKRNLNLYDIDY